MSEVNWDDNARASDKEIYRWANLKHRAGCSADTDKFFSELDITSPTQTKTVEDAVEKESEKWTHIDAFGDPCRILIEEKDNLGYVVILRQSGHYATPAASSLKPIKPKITKSQAWDKLFVTGLNIDDIVSQYDII